MKSLFLLVLSKGEGMLVKRLRKEITEMSVQGGPIFPTISSVRCQVSAVLARVTFLA